MALEYIPLLEKQLELYKIPLGPQRFEAYIKLTAGDATKTEDIPLPPLVLANPMAKIHALEYLQVLQKLNADKIAATTMQQAQRELDIQEELKVSTVLLDDLNGGWTNRYLNEAYDYFKYAERLKKFAWISVPCWTADSPSLDAIQQMVRAYMFRAKYVLEHGNPKTLPEVLQQEGLVMRFAGIKQWLEPEDLEYSKEVITPYLQSEHYPTQFACLFGDEAAKAVGYPPLGLSARAGFALALSLFD